MDIAVLIFVYGIAFIGAIISELSKKLRVLALLLGIQPLLLWTVVGALGAGDPASLPPLILYAVAIVLAIRESRNGSAFNRDAT